MNTTFRWIVAACVGALATCALAVNDTTVLPALAPSKPWLTLLESGTSGRGEVGPGQPGRILVEWRAYPIDGAWYVERMYFSIPTSGNRWHEVGRIAPPADVRDLELIDETIANLGKADTRIRRVDYRVCAASAAGKTCSVVASYPPAYSKAAIDNTPAPSRTTPRSAAAMGESGKTGALLIAAPQLLAPAAGSHVQGTLRVQIGTSPRGDAGNAEVEFTWQAPRQRQGGTGATADAPSPRTWKMPMAALVAGATVPPRQGPSQDGLWVARVRALRGAAPEPWSEPVSFTFSGTGNMTPSGRAEAAAAPARSLPALSSLTPQAPAAARAATPLPPKAPTALGAGAVTAPDWSKAAPSALSTPPSRGQP